MNPSEWNRGAHADPSQDTAALMERVLYEVKRVVVGQDHFLERMLVAILAQGHLLIEGVPGLAKTLTVNTLAKTIRGSFKRIQFTPDLLPAENLHFFARLYGLSDQDRQHRVAELMEIFELEKFANTPVGQLSGGWQQRLHLAVSLVHRPKLLVLDEPTAAVDIEARMDLWRLIEGLRDSGTTILLTSHHLAEAERLCSRVALMRSGKVLAEGSVPELLARIPGQAVAKVQSADHEAILQRALDLGWQVRQHADQIRLLLPFTFNLREIVDALDGTQVSAVSVHPVTLEDAYLELIGGSS